MDTTATAMKPLIGVTTYLEKADTEGCGRVSAAFLPETYLDAILVAGGVPVLLPPQPFDAAVIELLVNRLDGLVVAGGWDVDPSLYGQKPHPKTDVPRPERDQWEKALISEAIRQDVPLLGICRGEQMLNVALGGTLHQHLPDVIGCGQYQLGGYEYNLISVEIRPDSELGLLIDSQVLEAVPVSHHQAVDRLGDGLIATAWSDDQVVEAIEYPGNRFCMGIQWHPEELPEDSVLFRGLITAAQANSSSRLLPAMPTSSSPELNAG